MSTRTDPWPAGVPCWVDMTTPDVDAATAFYADVLGWTYADTGEEYGGYVIAQVDGSAAAGIGPQQGDAPPAWTLYISSEDADATAASISERGGTVLLDPGDVGSLGRMCIAADPTGAVFGVWQAGDHIGAGVVNEAGAVTWEDLRTTDPAAAHDFYTAVFGYRLDAVPGAPADYQTFALPDREAPLGGMGGFMSPADGQRSHWLVYFGVADADAAVAAAEEGGAGVVVPAFDTPFGRMAGLRDPAGADFWVAQTGGTAQPDWAD